ncbi:hypothetical protein [Fodinicola feengrottensis]|uniref:hypothetical protein n=1 Tax=Fodinicola feengrottensis TaxID=435914 RepID=UPI0024433F40|nr:hypothetical protein [Fodinicola feengrottensis]
MTDVLMPLMDLTGVAEAAEQAREEIDRLLAHNRLRRNSAPVSAEAALRGAHASAALEGAAYDLEAVRAGAVTNTVVQGALRVSGALGGPWWIRGRWRLARCSPACTCWPLGTPSRSPGLVVRISKNRPGWMLLWTC